MQHSNQRHASERMRMNVRPTMLLMQLANERLVNSTLQKDRLAEHNNDSELKELCNPWQH